MHDFRTRRDAFIASAEPGVAATRTLCTMTDEVVRELARAASSSVQGPWAVVALGGWGCGALQPTSDLDLLVLAEKDRPGLREFVDALLYPLWDTGVAVGHQVRTPGEQRSAMRVDQATCTAALTARAIAGDMPWAERVLDSCIADIARPSRKTLAALRERTRPGSAFSLDTDLKLDRGGRRDLDELTWTAALLQRTPHHDPAALIGLGIIERDEYEALALHAAVIATARWELARAGFGNRLDEESVDALNRVEPEAVHHALGSTALLLDTVRARVQTRVLTKRGLFTAPVTPPSTERPRHDSPLTSSQLFELLMRGPLALPELEDRALSGGLDALIPGFSAAMVARRPGMGHRFTLGAHLLRTATSIPELATASGALSASFSSLEDPRPTLFAALVHDLGKLDGGEDHAESGVAPAHDAALRSGLSDEQAHLVAEMVRHHLVLADVSMRSNLDDEDALLACAARIGDPSLLAPLHLITVADSLATSPALWTPWREALLNTLVTRLDAAFSPEVDGVGLTRRAEQTRIESRLLAPSTPEIKAFIDSAPARYLASRSPQEVLSHARLAIGLSSEHAGAPVRVHVTPGPIERSWIVVVAASDRPHLLARMAGAFSLAGLDILALDAFRAGDGVALDTFTVVSATDADVGPDTFARLERLMHLALHDRLDLVARLAERRRHYPACSQADTTVETHAAGWCTNVEVSAPDRPGLLHDIAAAMTESGLDIRWASAHTVDGVARDTFLVVGQDGGPVTDPGVLGHLAMRIRARC